MSYILLTEFEDGWQIEANGLECELTELAADSDVAQRLAEVVASEGLGLRPVVLALDYSSILSASFEIDKEFRQSRALVGYELERYLPWSAEEFVTDYCVVDRTVFGVAMKHERIRGIVEDIESRGFDVKHIISRHLYALQAVMKQRSVDDGLFVGWQVGDWFHVFQIESAQPVSWRIMPVMSDDIIRTVGYLALSHEDPIQMVLISAEEEIPDAMSELDVIVVDQSHHSSRQLLRENMQQLVRDQITPWFEFRHEELARPTLLKRQGTFLTTLKLITALSILVAAISFYYRSTVLLSQEEVYKEREAELFQSIFPGTRVPPAVSPRLKSELTRLSGARGESDVELPTPALGILELTLTSLAESGRCQILDIRVENERVQLEVRAKSFAVVNRIVESLRKAGFSVDPPTSHQSKNSVSSTIIGRSGESST